MNVLNVLRKSRWLHRLRVLLVRRHQANAAQTATSANTAEAERPLDGHIGEHGQSESTGCIGLIGSSMDAPCEPETLAFASKGSYYRGQNNCE